MEDKQKILNLLLPALQATDALHDLVALEYAPEKEAVIATFSYNGKKQANVAGDSGIAMILDVLRQIV